MNARAVPVLMYHHVSPSPGPFTVSPSTFRSQMMYMAKHGYHTLSAAQLSAFMRGKKPASARSVVITLDDGYLDNYVYAYPILKELGLNAILFAVTGWIGTGPTRMHVGMTNRPPPCPDHHRCKQLIAEGQSDAVILRWSELEQMRLDSTIEVQSHSHSHVRWDQLFLDPAARLTALHQDLETSLATLQRYVGLKELHLCWPWGYFEPDYLDLAESVGFSSQYTVMRGTNRPGDETSTIHRIDIKEKSLSWFVRQLRIYQSPLLTKSYLNYLGLRHAVTVHARSLAPRRLES